MTAPQVGLAIALFGSAGVLLAADLTLSARKEGVAGNALVLIVTGSGRRVAESFEGNRAAASLLRIVYR